MFKRSLIRVVSIWISKPQWLNIEVSEKHGAQLEISVSGDNGDTKKMHITTIHSKRRRRRIKKVPIHEGSNHQHVKIRLLRYAKKLRSSLNKKPKIFTPEYEPDE
jgi:hypothetical protein